MGREMGTDFGHLLLKARALMAHRRHGAGLGTDFGYSLMRCPGSPHDGLPASPKIGLSPCRHSAARRQSRKNKASLMNRSALNLQRHFAICQSGSNGLASLKLGRVGQGLATLIAEPGITAFQHLARVHR